MKVLWNQTVGLITQHHGYSKYHYVVYVWLVNFMLCDFHLSKKIIIKNLIRGERVPRGPLSLLTSLLCKSLSVLIPPTGDVNPQGGRPPVLGCACHRAVVQVQICLPGLKSFGGGTEILPGNVALIKASA
jgi:hypothetical protein